MKNLALKKYQEKLEQVIDLIGLSRPKEGWIRSVRKALGMSGPQLAKRLDLSAAQVSQMERLEVQDRITLRKLREVADELDCELVYAFVPRQSAEEIVKAQAELKAKELVLKTNQQMQLEAQQFPPEKLEQMIEQETSYLLREMPRWLWD